MPLSQVKKATQTATSLEVHTNRHAEHILLLRFTSTIPTYHIIFCASMLLFLLCEPTVVAIIFT